MKIPKKYQIFEEKIVILDEERDRLSPSLAGWPTLQKTVLSVPTLSQFDLRRLIILELMDRRRSVIIDRLVMRLGKIHQSEIREKIKKLTR